MRLARAREPDADRVRREPRSVSALRRHVLAATRVVEPEQDRDARPGPACAVIGDAPGVRRLPQRDGSDPVGPRALDGEVGDVPQGDVAERMAPVEAHDRPEVELHHRPLGRRELAPGRALDVLGEPAHAMRLVPGEVRGDDRLRREGRVLGPHPDRLENLSGEAPELAGSAVDHGGTILRTRRLRVASRPLAQAHGK